MKTKSIILYPTSNQKLILKQYIGAYRYMYNETLKYINSKNWYSYQKVKKNEEGQYIEFEGDFIKVQRYGTHIRKYKLPTLEGLRTLLKSKRSEWFYTINSHLMDSAIDECCKNFKTNLSKKKQFQMKPKFKKNITNTMQFEKEAFSKKQNAIYIKTLGKMRSSEKFKDLDKVGSSLTYHKVHKSWRLNCVFNYEQKKIVPCGKICALDPGEKIFMTSYSKDECFMFGTDASKKLYERCQKIDKIHSALDKSCKQVERRILRKRLHNQIKRIQFLRKEMHHKIANFLTLNYDTIILPEFKTSEMVSKLHSKVARSMYNLSFYQFKIHMKAKCEERGNKLIIGTEAYSTKTCTHCGSINRPNDREYRCSNCNLEIHRDLNGARNILLMNVDKISGELAPRSVYQTINVNN